MQRWGEKPGSAIAGFGPGPVGRPAGVDFETATATATAEAQHIGYPVVLKAAAGTGEIDVLTPFLAAAIAAVQTRHGALSGQARGGGGARPPGLACPTRASRPGQPCFVARWQPSA